MGWRWGTSNRGLISRIRGGKLRPLQMEEVQMVGSDRLHCIAYRLYSVITDAFWAYLRTTRAVHNDLFDAYISKLRTLSINCTTGPPS